ncbi:MAG: long-chain fatty acid--CoA ligase [Patescibacteria group bacterium]|jgi:long-chain acyl-CoA synthetase
MQTIPQKFQQTAEKFAKKPALKFKYHNAYISLSFAELAQRVKTLAKGFQALGLNQGDRLAILSENRSEWVRADLAALTIGAIVVPVHTTVSPQIIKHILNDSASRIVLVSNQENFNKLVLAAKDLPALETIIYINLDSLESNHFEKKLISLEAVMKLGQNSQKEITAEIKPDDVASIIYTSGTTALPKGVMLTHHNFLFDAEAAVTAVPVDEHDTLLSFLPLSHVLERTAGYYAPLVCRGCCIAYAENMKTLVANLREVRPTIMVSVPRIFERVHTKIWEKIKAGGKLKYQIFIWALKQEPGTIFYRLADFFVFGKIRASFGGRLRLTICGGATLNYKMARFFGRIGLKICEGYGLTETAPVTTVNRPGNLKFGTVGQQLPGVEIKIAADKEILVKGPNVMKGYYQKPDLTKEAIDAEGWFHTGDLGFISSDGFLVIIGRKKEMISLSNGKIAWPESLEVILENDKFIAQAMVYGHNKSYLTALVVPDWQEAARRLVDFGISGKEPDQLVVEPELIKIFAGRIEKINEQLADWEKIRKFVLISREFSQEKDELTPTLKLRRPAIETNYQKELQKLY